MLWILGVNTGPDPTFQFDADPDPDPDPIPSFKLVGNSRSNNF